MNNKSIPTGICSNSSSEVFMNLIGRNIPCVFHDKTNNYCFNPNDCKKKQKLNNAILEDNDEKKFNIIFLDIDGVLNGYNKWNLLGWNIVKRIKYKPLELWYKRITEPFGVHESKVKRLAKIVKATDAKIVMSSSWRYGWWNLPYEEQYEDQKQLTDLLNKYNIEVIDITPTLKSGNRGEEIAQWLHDNKYMVNSFIILDDENTDMYPFNDSSRFIQTSNVPKDVMIMGKPNENTGLKRKHIKPAINMLQYKILKILY